MTMRERLEKILNRGFLVVDEYNGNYYQFFNKETNEELPKVVEDVFELWDYDNDYSIEHHVLYSNGGYSVGYCAIAWIENNQLETMVIEFEND